jgi:23S rRNA (cytidine1920-2'-O)/16S rRNA (cytidine1409-2'-O)-methyltransferase
MESDQKKIRIDLLLVKLGIATSRNKAQQLIDSKSVLLKKNHDWVPVQDSSLKVDEETSTESIQVNASPETKFVSRSGAKLEAALSRLNLVPRDWFCLDVGQSTGGFTQCLVEAGAAQVIGVDVGRGQLEPGLQNHPKIKSIEGLDARKLQGSMEFKNLVAEFSAEFRSASLVDVATQVFDLCVVDCSFISTLSLTDFLHPWSRRFLILVKPQFEMGKDFKIRDSESSEMEQILKDRFTAAWLAKGFQKSQFFKSAVKGKEGTQEYFFYTEDV